MSLDRYEFRSGKAGFARAKIAERGSDGKARAAMAFYFAAGLLALTALSGCASDNALNSKVDAAYHTSFAVGAEQADTASIL